MRRTHTERTIVAVALAAGLATTAAAQESWTLAAAPGSWLGEQAWSGAGRVAAVGDLDGDGTTDLAIGAPMDDTDWPDAGRVYLFSGARALQRNRSVADADVVIGGAAPSDLLGWSVTGIGDVNHDGHDDLAVGVLLDRVGEGSGTLRLFFGPWQDWGATVDIDDADVVVVAEHLYTGLGTNIVNAGDIDGDGLDDLWIGAPFTKLDPYDPGAMEVEELKLGRVHLVLGRTDWPDELMLGPDSYLTITGQVEGSMLGSSIAAGSDISGDGEPDLCVGSPGAALEYMEGRGQVHCFTQLRGMPPGDHPVDLTADLVIPGRWENARAGTALAFVDFDGDGIDDIVSSSPYSEEASDAGGAIVGFAGGPLLPTGELPWQVGAIYMRGEFEYGCLGYAIEPVGDLDGDGYEDMLVSAPGADIEDAHAAGVVYLVAGRPAGEPWPPSSDQLPLWITGEQPMDRVGTHLAFVGELGMGAPVSLIGSIHQSQAGTEAGKVYLLHDGIATDDDGDGFTELEGDCRDDDPDSYPGADADPDRDDDCDGATENDGDCDDADATCFPGAPEFDDGLDNDCDGDVDEVPPAGSDLDGDGWSNVDGDCDDADAAVFPGATEVCNERDDNCNGVLDDVAGGCDEAEADDDDDDSADDGVDGGCDCALGSAPAPSAVLPLALLAGLALRRRASR